jgi:hypothetical protein
MAKVKQVITIDPNRRRTKHTSQGNGRSANTVVRSKQGKKQFKRYRGQGR